MNAKPLEKKENIAPTTGRPAHDRAKTHKKGLRP
jgi:hypothetical protein